MTLKTSSNPMTLKRAEVFQLINHFRNLGKYKGEKFAAFFSKNLHRLDSKMKSINKHIDNLRPAPEELKAFADAEEKLFVEYAKKTLDGSPVMKGPNSYDIDPGRKTEFDTKLKEMRESDEHKDAWDRIERFQKEQTEYLDGETDFEPHRIYDEFLPEDLTGNDRYPIEDFIIERIDD